MTEKEISELYTRLAFQYESAIDILLAKRLIDTELATATKEKFYNTLDMQCVDTNRDLFSFLKRERVQMLRLAKEQLTEEQAQEDDRNTVAIQENLDTINGQVSSLHYVSTALERVNKELSDLSFHNEDQFVRFVAGESDAGKLLDNLILSYSTAEKPLSPGGDGRNNQIFLATWISI